METASVYVANYCQRCGCRCRYCLLDWRGTCPGVPNHDAMDFTRRFAAWFAAQKHAPAFGYYAGYAMDLPELREYLRFLREIRSPQAGFLQLNGMDLRTEEEMRAWLRAARDGGADTLCPTFYGTRDYHDAFCARKGDFDNLMRLSELAAAGGFHLSVTYPILRSNLHMAAEVVARCEELTDEIHVLSPHAKGRGRLLNGERITLADLEQLPQTVRRRYSRQAKAERDWIREGFPTPARRSLTLVLTRENFPALQAKPFEETLAMLEELDDAYYAAMPSAEELAAEYGDPDGTKLYRGRDLLLEWQQRYREAHAPDLHDMQDERHHFSVRY